MTTRARLNGGEGAPQVRARYMQIMLRAFESTTHGLHPLESIFSTAVLARVEQAGALTWLPLDVNHAVVKGIYESLGEARTRRFFRGLLLEVFGSALFRRFVEGLLHVFEPTPANALKWVPQGWAVMFRDCGNWTIDVKEQSAALELAQLTPACFDPSWREAMVGGLASLLEVVRYDGDVDLVEHDAQRGLMRFEFVWSEARRSK